MMSTPYWSSPRAKLMYWLGPAIAAPGEARSVSGAPPSGDGTTCEGNWLVMCLAQLRLAMTRCGKHCQADVEVDDVGKINAGAVSARRRSLWPASNTGRATRVLKPRPPNPWARPNGDYIATPMGFAERRQRARARPWNSSEAREGQ